MNLSGGRANVRPRLIPRVGANSRARVLSAASACSELRPDAPSRLQAKEIAWGINGANSDGDDRPRGRRPVVRWTPRDRTMRPGNLDAPGDDAVLPTVAAAMAWLNRRSTHNVSASFLMHSGG
jgi:hypothetical protein